MRESAGSGKFIIIIERDPDGGGPGRFPSPKLTNLIIKILTSISRSLSLSLLCSPVGGRAGLRKSFLSPSLQLSRMTERERGKNLR